MKEELHGKSVNTCNLNLGTFKSRPYIVSSDSIHPDAEGATRKESYESLTHCPHMESIVLMMKHPAPRETDKKISDLEAAFVSKTYFFFFFSKLFPQSFMFLTPYYF